MTIIQDTFYVPDNIAIGLAEGIYKRFGSVVRWAVGDQKGQIVTHLKPIPTKNTSTANGSNTESVLFESVAQQVYEFVLNHKTMSIIVAGVVVTASTSIGIKLGINKYRKKAFQKAFRNYNDALRSGTMTIDIIENLDRKLYGLKSVKLSSEELSSIVGYIKNYTVKLANDNQIAIKEINSDDDKNQYLDSIRLYIETQKQIFKKAA